MCCSASVASSSRRNASFEALSLRLNSSDRISRAEDEPTALASSCSEKRMTSMPACSLPFSLPPLLFSKVWNERSVRSTPR